MGLSLSWVMRCQVTIKKTVILTVTRFISGYVQCFWKHTVEATCLCKQTECSLLKHTGREGTDFMLSRCFCVDGGLYLRLFSDLSVLVGTFVWLFTLLTWLTENSGEEQHSSHIHPAGETPDSTKPKISFLSFFFSQQRFRRRSRTNKLLNIYWGRFGIHNRVPSKENSFLKPGQ